MQEGIFHIGTGLTKETVVLAPVYLANIVSVLFAVMKGES